MSKPCLSYCLSWLSGDPLEAHFEQFLQYVAVQCSKLQQLQCKMQYFCSALAQAAVSLFIKFATGFADSHAQELRGLPCLEKCCYLLHMAARAWPGAADGSKFLGLDAEA